MFSNANVFGGFFVLGFASRFILALVILIYLYSKSKSDKALKRGLITLIICGVTVLVLGILLSMAVFTLGSFFSFGNLPF